MSVENLLLYSAQVAILTATGWGLSWLLREKHPKARLLHWQILLFVSLVLPLAGPRYTPPAEFADVSIATGPATAVAGGAGRFSFPDLSTMLLWMIGLGSALLLLRMTLGSIRIHLYRRRARLMEGARGEAEIRFSGELNSPITFGWLRPVVLLPESFLDLPEQQQRAVLTHELTHVRRRDWLFTIVEETIRALLWFHPAIWFLLARIQLEREQVVDHETITITGSRDIYLDALLAVAGLKSRFDFVPAPLFLRRRHLAQRVATVLKEVSPMNPKRMFFSLAASSVALLAAGFFTSTLLPLRATAQQSVGDPGEVQVKRGPRLIQQARAVYPPAAKLKRIEGVVALEVNVGANGLVTDAHVLSGPDELRRSALQAVLQWQFEPGDAATRAEVEINFKIRETTPSAAIGVLKRIEFVNVPADMQRRLAPRIPVKEGDILTGETAFETNRAISEIALNYRATLSDDNVLRIAPGMPPVPGTIRVGGNVQAAKVKKQVRPLYPPEAKQARIQGTVRLSVRIDKEGKIANMEVIGGHPLLIPAATEAVKQWEYETTLLNGNPVEVMTQVDINFTLSDGTPPPAVQ